MDLPEITSKKINTIFNKQERLDREMIRLSYKTFLHFGIRDSQGANKDFARAYAKCVIYMIWSNNSKSKKKIKELVQTDLNINEHQFALQYATIVTGVPIEEKLYLLKRN